MRPTITDGIPETNEADAMALPAVDTHAKQADMPEYMAARAA